MSFYTTSLGPPVGDSTAMYAPPLRYKREALVAHFRKHSKTLTTQARFHAEQPCSQPLESTRNTTHSGRRVLRSGGQNHSKLLCSSRSSTEIGLILANPRVRTLRVYAGALRHPAVGLHITTFGCGFAHHYTNVYP